MLSGVPDLRLGILLTTQRHGAQSDAEVFERALRLAERADRSGLDDLWVTEHHFSDASLSSSALALASFLLGRTRHVHVGTAVTQLPLHSPVHVAEQAALLQHLSGNRFLLGVGRGMPLIDYDVLGGGAPYWHGGLEEALDLVVRAGRGQVHQDSGLYSFPPVTTMPRPPAGSGLPVYVAASSPRTITLAADQGLPMLLFFDKDAEAKAEMVALHRRQAAAAGHPEQPYDHAFALFAHVTEDPSEAERLIRDRARQLVESAQLAPLMAGAPRQRASATQRAEAVEHVTAGLLATQPVGSTAMCVERLVRHIAVSGVRRVLCQVEASGSTAGAIDNLDRLSTDVFPEVRRRVAERPVPSGR
ncbi:LLM class flavin-dependent oxidoreductase [Streptomyces albidoflavus]|uniref:LLM class flavin-dependent oxidoreductase n=1 Tax=Streptomyces albidoflavus TaxID=1886 RepID=UPI0033B1F158